MDRSPLTPSSVEITLHLMALILCVALTSSDLFLSLVFPVLSLISCLSPRPKHKIILLTAESLAPGTKSDVQ